MIMVTPIVCHQHNRRRLASHGAASCRSRACKLSECRSDRAAVLGNGGQEHVSGRNGLEGIPFDTTYGERIFVQGMIKVTVCSAICSCTTVRVRSRSGVCRAVSWLLLANRQNSTDEPWIFACYGDGDLCNTVRQ